VGTVGRGDPVVGSEYVAYARRDGLLALVLVERAGDLAVEKKPVDPVLEAADEKDTTVKPENLVIAHW
jgi:hypothetical protein